MSPYRPAFEAALRMFAEISDAMERAGHGQPILVGGAAVELYTGSAIATGDADLVTGRQDAFEASLQARGSSTPALPRIAYRGTIRPCATKPPAASSSA